MQSYCTKCGAKLADELQFCTACGTPHSKPTEQAAVGCAKCGTPIAPDLRFCTACGSLVAQPAQVPSAQVAHSADYAPIPVLTPQPQKKSALGKILIAVAALAFVIVAGVIAAGIYVGYRIKKKAQHIEQVYKGTISQAASDPAAEKNPSAEPDLGKVISAIGQAGLGKTGGGGSADFGKMLEAVSKGESGGSLDRAKILAALGHTLEDNSQSKVESRPAGSCRDTVKSSAIAYERDATSASIPLVPGLTLTDVWTPRANQPDVEILTTVDEVSGDSIHVTGKRLVGNGVSAARNLCLADLMDGRDYETGFSNITPTTIPGATMFTLSRVVFSDLKASRPTALTYYEAKNNNTGGYDLNVLSKGTLARVEPADVPYSIIVNGERKELPAIHAKGLLGTRTFDIWVLDDSANPLVLNLKVQGSAFHITYVKITFPEKKQVERQLATTGHADIYGIYFDFDKSTPRPESAPVLKEIAQALANNPKWRLEIHGHTDNSGGNSYNLNLSEQRAQGIMRSLVAQYGIAADRLSAKGFGPTQPKATNDTPEGRALNRRVELVRN